MATGWSHHRGKRQEGARQPVARLGLPVVTSGHVDPVVPTLHVGATFSPDLLWDDDTVATTCRVFAGASRRGENSLVMRPGGWMVSWWANSFSLSLPANDLPRAKERVLELVNALDVSIRSVSVASWSDLVGTQ